MYNFFLFSYTKVICPKLIYDLNGELDYFCWLACMPLVSLARTMQSHQFWTIRKHGDSWVDMHYNSVFFFNFTHIK